MGEAPPRRAYPEDLTAEEKNAIDSLARLARRWPPTLGLFSWSGSLRVCDRSDAVLDYIEYGPAVGEVRTIDNVPTVIAHGIPNEGGDPDEIE